MIAQALVSPLEYLRREREAETKHEFYDGVVCEMAGASRNHVEIQGALATEIGIALRRENLSHSPRRYEASRRTAILPIRTR